MKIGLIDIEPKIFNTAYMQIARYHKDRGDTIEWWAPLIDRQFNHVYCSSLFDYTDKSEVPKRAICGGTGFNVSSRLSVLMEESDLDYSIYPKCDKSFIWFSRGCIRNCPWCVVRQKEGFIHPVGAKNINPLGTSITVCDNNFFANPNWRSAILFLGRYEKQPIDFQGIDVRTLNPGRARLLQEFKRHKQIKIAWDDPHDLKIEVTIRAVAEWFPKGSLMCYVLIGFSSTPEQDLYRVETLRGLGIDPFVMPFNRSDLYQKAFARWVNHKAIFKKVKWEDYNRRVTKQEAAGCGWSSI